MTMEEEQDELESMIKVLQKRPNNRTNEDLKKLLPFVMTIKFFSDQADDSNKKCDDQGCVGDKTH